MKVRTRKPAQRNKAHVRTRREFRVFHGSKLRKVLAMYYMKYGVMCVVELNAFMTLTNLRRCVRFNQVKHAAPMMLMGAMA